MPTLFLLSRSWRPRGLYLGCRSLLPNGAADGRRRRRRRPTVETECRAGAGADRFPSDARLRAWLGRELVDGRAEAGG